jgi:single-strand DNA-binding protein
MGSVNKAILVGHVGRAAELRRTGAGTPVATFTMATTQEWTKDQVKHSQTEWHRIVVWGKAGERLVGFLTKGRQVYVEGRLTTRSWEKDGQKHHSTEIKADNIVLLGKRQDAEPEMPEHAAADTPVPAAVGAFDDDDIPF